MCIRDSAYTDQPISQEDKELILKAALQAPTAGNMALYSIIDIQQQSLKDELALRCDHQPFIAKAPMVLIFLADYQKWFDIFEAFHHNIPPLEESDLLLACLLYTSYSERMWPNMTSNG